MFFGCRPLRLRPSPGRKHCGNRCKQDTTTDEEGNPYYTGGAPSCLVDQKAATHYVKYNILLGNLPGNVDYFVSTGGSGGGAYAVMLTATGSHSDYYDYLIEAGAVGIYQYEDGAYTTTVTIDGTDYDLSDCNWGCIACSAITPLYEADMALAFEYYLDTGYSFSPPPSRRSWRSICPQLIWTISTLSTSPS